MTFAETLTWGRDFMADQVATDERDLSGHHLSVGKIAGVIAALCGVAMAVLVPAVWWAAALHTQVSAINSSLDSMKGSVAIAAGVAKDLERERDRVSELKTRVDVLYSRTDHLMATERAREIAREQNR
jgi:hypothetical protein